MWTELVGIFNFRTQTNIARRVDSADLVDVEELDSLIRVRLVLDGILLKDELNILLLIRKTHHIHFLVHAFKFPTNPVNIFHVGEGLALHILKFPLHDDGPAFFIPIQISEDDIVSASCKLDPVDMVDDGIYFVELDEQVDVIILELWLDVDDLDSASLEVRLSVQRLGDVLPVAALDEYHHEQVGVALVNLLQILFGSEEDIEPPIDVCLIGKVVVLEVIETVKHFLAE